LWRAPIGYITNQLVISDQTTMLHTLLSRARVPVALLSLAVLAACQKPPVAQEPIRAVKVMTVGATAGTAELEFSGEVRARVESSLGFRVSGKVLSRAAEIGQRVQAGQLLAQLDPQDYRLAADATAAQLVAAQTNRDLAVADLKRYQDLRAQGFISAAELQRREASLAAAQAQWQQAQAQNSVQGNQSGYTRLVADGAGVITSVDANAGQVVAAGQPVVRLALDGARDVVFAVPEDKLALFKTGQTVAVRLWGRDKTLQAQIRDVAASADTVTRTFLVKAALPQSADAVLGATVTIVKPATPSSAAATLKLPSSALRLDGNATSVWVLDPASMTVKSQAIEVKTADGNDAVVTSGLKAGDQVVMSGVHVLTAGQKVSIFGAGK
jgi:multidrug efflux system membrane fusion protein